MLQANVKLGICIFQLPLVRLPIDPLSMYTLLDLNQELGLMEGK